MENKIRRYSSGAPWEQQVGYTRAVRNGAIIEVSGTTATIDGQVQGIGDAYQQTKVILGIIAEAIKALGGDINQTIRTRMYTTDIALWEEIGKAHQETFGSHAPASTLVEVSKLIHPDLLVEIEATAIM